MFFEHELATVYYELRGPEDGPAVVFCHGPAADHRSFQGQAEALQDRYRVLVWDLPFHGRSDPFDLQMAYTTPAADLLMALLDHLGMDSALLVGHSLGSFVIQKAAVDFPERATATIHVGGIPLHPKAPAPIRLLHPFAHILDLLPEEWTNNKLATGRAGTASARRYFEECAKALPKRHLIHLYREMLHDLAAGLPHSPPQPLLLVCGDRDAAIIRRWNLQWHNLTEHSTLVTVPQARSAAHQDNPEHFIRVLREFIAQVDG